MCARAHIPAAAAAVPLHPAPPLRSARARMQPHSIVTITYGAAEASSAAASFQPWAWQQSAAATEAAAPAARHRPWAGQQVAGLA